MQRFLAGLLVLGMTAGCAGSTANVAPAPTPVVVPTDPVDRLRQALELETWSPAQIATIAEVQALTGAPWVEMMRGEVVRDTAASEAARVNSLLHLGERLYIANFRIYREGVRAREPVVRAATMVALGQVLNRKPESVLPLLKRGLRDADINVQAKALQSLSDNDADALREYIASSPGQQLRAVAEDLLEVAEERGAPLADSATLATAAELSRVHSSGARIAYRPARKWPQWQASLGALFAATATGELAHVADSVEVVGGVVPAFLSTDGRYLVYESARTIHVRDLQTGADRRVGPGTAPRSVPFTQTFVYLVERPDERSAERDATQLSYAVMQADFAGNAAGHVTGSAKATSRMGDYGGYSPVRLMRVTERNGHFFLEGPTMTPVALPSPFTQAS